ncbi:hypothetical protein WDR94_004222 [Citrobacter amalonaticus]
MQHSIRYVLFFYTLNLKFFYKSTLQFLELLVMFIPSTTSASLSGDKRSGSREDGKGKSMEKAYEEYFEGLAKGEEALSFAEFKEALS